MNDFWPCKGQKPLEPHKSRKNKKRQQYLVEANEDLVEQNPARHNFKRGFGPRDETLHSNLDFEAESQVNSTKKTFY